jgi:hypothetical protein
MTKKYIKRHDIQHFNIRDIVFIKVLKEDRTSINNKHLFKHILKEPYSYKYKVITLLGIIKHLIPTKGIRAIKHAL